MSLPRCHCGAEAVVFVPGDAGEESDMFLLRRPVADRAWCMPCAVLAGFPWLTGDRRGRAKRIPRTVGH